MADALTRLTDSNYMMSILHVDDPRLRKDIIERYHQHLSTRKTLQNIKSKYYWERMKDFVVEAERRCGYCARNRFRGENRTLLKPIIPEGLWEVVGIDFIPNMILKNGERKNAAIIVDYFSGESEVFGMTTLTAEEFREKFQEKWIEVHGAPQMIVSDRATQLLSSKFSMVIKEWDIDYQPTSSMHQQASGKVENKIKMFKRLLHSHLEGGVGFREAIRKTKGTLNNQVVSDASGYTPYHIM